MDRNRAFALSGFNKLAAFGDGFDSHRPLQSNQLLTDASRSCSCSIWFQLKEISYRANPFQTITAAASILSVSESRFVMPRYF